MKLFENLKPTVRQAFIRWEKTEETNIENEINLSSENFKRDCLTSLKIVNRRLEIISLQCEDEIDTFLKIIPYSETLNINWPNWYKSCSNIIRNILTIAKNLPFRNKALENITIAEREYFKMIRDAFETSHRYSENFYTDLTHAKETISKLAKIINSKILAVNSFIAIIKDSIRINEE